MCKYLKDAVSGFVWGFSLALGWIAAFAVLGMIAA